MRPRARRGNLPVLHAESPSNDHPPQHRVERLAPKRKKPRAKPLRVPSRGSKALTLAATSGSLRRSLVAASFYATYMSGLHGCQAIGVASRPSSRRFGYHQRASKASSSGGVALGSACPLVPGPQLCSSHGRPSRTTPHRSLVPTDLSGSFAGSSHGLVRVVRGYLSGSGIAAHGAGLNGVFRLPPLPRTLLAHGGASAPPPPTGS